MSFQVRKQLGLTGTARALRFLWRPVRSFFASLMEPWRLARDSSGQMLIEVIIAITIFSVVGTSVLLGVRVAHTSSRFVENHSIAERLARNQIESVFNQAYQPPQAEPVAYDTLAEAEACGSITGYSVCAEGLELLTDDGLQGSIERVVVTVSLNGKVVLVLETLRAE